MRLLRRLRHSIERLGPYPSLFLLAVPLAIVEPLKLTAAFIAGDGHWFTGLVLMLCAYCVSLFVTERLFVIVKPKLLRLRWFRKFWTLFVGIRSTALGWLRAKWTLGLKALKLASSAFVPL